jgi:hypothetical protein
MNVEFEMFETGPVVQTHDRVHVTIDKLGHFFLNRHAMHALGSPDMVTLMYDRRRSIMGVMPSPLHKRRSYPLRNKDGKRGRGRRVHAMNFFRTYGIRPSETLAFTSPEVNKDGILILSLHEVRSVKKTR